MDLNNCVVCSLQYATTLDDSSWKLNLNIIVVNCAASHIEVGNSSFAKLRYSFNIKTVDQASDPMAALTLNVHRWSQEGSLDPEGGRGSAPPPPPPPRKITKI